ncbi:MAG: ComF family protein [Candidatus Nealsonbacteria bacterium]
MKNKLKRFFLDLLFPKTCFGCQKPETYLCCDCEAILEVSDIHKKLKTEQLSDLYFALEYKKSLIKTLISQFKCQPFIKELSRPLSSLIINHFQLIEKNKNDFKDFIIIPVPLHIKKLKWRGFNQAEEIGKHLSEFFKIPLINNVLIKKHETIAQTELAGIKRERNVLNVFQCENTKVIKNKNIILIDDIYITGSTINECARVLKQSGAGKVIGIVVAITEPK